MTDSAAVRRARTGDGEAFRLLVERHSHAIFLMAWRLTGSEHDADEVVQETFLRAWRRLHSFGERASFGTWLTTIAVHCAVDVRRARKEQRFADVETAPSPDPLPDRLFFSAEIRAHVMRAMEELTANEKTAFILRHFDGMTTEEIGHVLGVGISAVKHTTFRAVQKLRVSLEPLVRSADACDGRTARPAHLR